MQAQLRLGILVLPMGFLDFFMISMFVLTLAVGLPGQSR